MDTPWMSAVELCQDSFEKASSGMAFSMNATCFENSLRHIKPARRPTKQDQEFIDDELSEGTKASEDDAQEKMELDSNGSYEPESDESGKLQSLTHLKANWEIIQFLRMTI
ncbi:hypothetical protein FPCIR_1312 [Fusarium pseudocircinatum]|uniref:Uncharacterized protein n=1 Tax=Fusarium pseudocircinatum TaxID=56676 RepID=A0A8H5PUV6_9HYPO|nr:hypothetical protein FPCIR_1312 [Fusarium pseudocircinatum]